MQLDVLPGGNVTIAGDGDGGQLWIVDNGKVRATRPSMSGMHLS